MNSIFSPDLQNKPTVVNGPKVGDILVSVSGYEASIAWWVKVVGVTGKSVKIVHLPADNKYSGCGGMEWISTPATDRIKGETETSVLLLMATAIASSATTTAIIMFGVASQFSATTITKILG